MRSPFPSSASAVARARTSSFDEVAPWPQPGIVKMSRPKQITASQECMIAFFCNKSRESSPIQPTVFGALKGERQKVWAPGRPLSGFSTSANNASGSRHPIDSHSLEAGAYQLAIGWEVEARTGNENDWDPTRSIRDSKQINYNKSGQGCAFELPGPSCAHLRYFSRAASPLNYPCRPGGEDGGRRVPMIRRGDVHRVNVLVV